MSQQQIVVPIRAELLVESTRHYQGNILLINWLHYLFIYIVSHTHLKQKCPEQRLIIDIQTLYSYLYLIYIVIQKGSKSGIK